MIDEADAEKCVEWLIKNVTKAAQARAQREHLEAYTKVIKARLMAEFADKPATIQEREAYAHPDYEAHLEALREAIEIDEQYRWRKEAAATKVSVWQSINRAKIV